jgi:hypothetical protein
MARRGASFGVLLLAACAASGKKDARDSGKDVAPWDLAQQVAQQSSRIRQLEAQLSKVGRGSCAAGADAEDPEPELRPFRILERQRAADKRQEQLLTLFNVSVGEPLTAVAISTNIVEKGVPKLVVGAGASGTLYLYDRNGTRSLTLPLEGKPSKKAPAPDITALAIGPREDPFVAVGSRAGHVSVYNLTLPRAKVGSRAATTETALSLATRVEPHLDASGKPVPVLTLDTYQRGRRAMLAVGDSEGSLRLYWRNGTQRSGMEAGGAVQAMERGGANAAFLAVGAAGVGVKLFDMGKPNNAPLVCEGSAPGLEAGDEIVSLAWDVQLTQLLYAGSRDGIVSVFNTRARTRVTDAGIHANETRMVTQCKLVTTVPGHDVSPVALTPLKGYLLSASTSLLVAHNVSGLYARTRDDPNVMLGRSLASAAKGTVPRPTVLSGTRAGHVVVGSGSGGFIALLSSKLPFKTAEEAEGGIAGFLGSGGGGGGMGGGMFKNPLMLGGVMFLVFWQSGKMFNKSGKGGGRGGPPEDFDMDMLRSAMGGAGMGGAGMGGAGFGGAGMGGAGFGGAGTGGMHGAAFDEAFRDFKSGRRVPESRFEEVGGASSSSGPRSAGMMSPDIKSPDITMH